MTEHKVGEVVRIEYNQEDDSVKVVIEILDENFKQRLLHDKDLADTIKIVGKSAIQVAK